MSPLPRFHRLPHERQSAILGVAREHFAEHGPENASYNKIIEAAGFSKTAAYQYFDGRDDLLAAVLDDVLTRLLGALGPWTPQPDPAAFWARLDAGAGALAAHLHGHPQDLALAEAAISFAGSHDDGQSGDGVSDSVGGAGGPWLGWFEAVVADGQRLGVVRADLDRGLLVAATAAVVRAADSWALRELHAGREPDSGQLWSLLRGLWSRPDGVD